MANIKLETRLLQTYSCIAGIDEVGRGPLAGPVVTACVVLKPEFHRIYKVTDSKLLDEKTRHLLFDKITKRFEYSIGLSTPQEIDSFNIVGATQLAIDRTFKELQNKPEITLIDGYFPKPFNFKNKLIPKGDLKHFSIAAASIIAKVFRDEIMIEYDKEFPEYGFAAHKGYGTKQHRDAIERYGLCPIHRKTFMSQLKLI